MLQHVSSTGSGKTTLLNLIGCIDRPEGGRVLVDGAETGNLPERALTQIRAQKIGFIFQQFFLLPTLTVRENVALPAVFGGNGDRGGQATALLDRVGLAGRADHLPFTVVRRRDATRRDCACLVKSSEDHHRR